MNSEKIQVGNKWYFVDVEDLYEPTITKLFLFHDQDLTKIASDEKGTLMVKKSDLEDQLREWGGAGFSMGGGSSIFPVNRGGQMNRGGFGGASNLGGPNMMYTYEIKPLNRLLQPDVSDVEDAKEQIHDGSYIEGEEMNKKDGELYRGTVLTTYKEDDQVFYYIILNDETSQQMKIDPTTAVLLSGETYFDDPDEEDQEGGLGNDTPDLMRSGKIHEKYRAKFVNEEEHRPRFVHPVETTVDEFMTWYAGTPEWSQDWQTSNVMEVNGKHAQEDDQDGMTHLLKLEASKNQPITLRQNMFRPGDWDLSFEIEDDEYSLQSSIQAFAKDDDY